MEKDWKKPTQPAGTRKNRRRSAFPGRRSPFSTAARASGGRFPNVQMFVILKTQRDLLGSFRV
ncbi:MAG: hypothetical protein P8008_02545 [Gammaproteobacteria bacterium]